MIALVPASFESDAADGTEYHIYIDLGGTVSSAIFFDDPAVDYGDAEWITVVADNAKDALVAACEMKFGPGSLEVTSSGYIKTINGMGGNGIAYFSDQAFTGDADQWGISYYPVQFIYENGAWVYGDTPIAAYDGDSTTFAVVCQPTSMDAEPVDFTFTDDGGAYATNWETYDMYMVSDGYDLQAIYDEYFAGYYGWSYGTPSEPFFAPKTYSIYIDLGGTVSGFFLGTDADYGEGSWETVTATTAMDALTLACEQKFGPGCITYNVSSWGTSISYINGMSGNGGSMKSDQAGSWDDVYFYPVQFIKENDAWRPGEVTIPNYMGNADTFAITFMPLTFDEIEHTFADDGDQAVYELLMSTYAWPGYGEFQEPFVSTAGVSVNVSSVRIELGDTYAAKLSFAPSDATNKNGTWSSSDESVAIVDQSGTITAVGYGNAEIAFVCDYGMYTASVDVKVPAPQEYNIYLDLGGEISSAIIDLDADTPVDYGAASWVTVTATNAKDALFLACEQKYGAGSLDVTSSGYIKTINGIGGNGIAYFSDQAFTGDADQWGISYYPVQFINEGGVWEYGSTPIAAYEGDSTTFAIVCQPTSMDAEPVDFTFTDEGGAYAVNWDTFDMYKVSDGYDLQAIFDGYFAGYYGWQYGTPSEPFFVSDPIEVGDVYDDGTLVYKVTSVAPNEAEVIGYVGSPKIVAVPVSFMMNGEVVDVTSIGEKAFYACTSLRVLDLGSVEKVGVKAFANCVKLNTLCGGDSLETVSAYAFYRCVRLADVNLYDSAKSLRIFGSYSFYKCDKISEIIVPSYMTKVAAKAFSQTFADEDLAPLDVSAKALKGYPYANVDGVFVRQPVVEIGTTYSDDMFSYKVVTSLPAEVEVVSIVASMANVVVPETVVFDQDFAVIGIGDNAFNGNKTLRTIDISDVEYVGKQAFYGCAKLTSVSMDDVVSIGVKAFSYCKNLSDVKLGDDLETVSAYAFSKCTSLKTIDLNGAKLVGSYAFFKCTSLETVLCGVDLEKIGGHAFDGCSGLSAVQFSSTLKYLGLESFGDIVFEDIDGNQVSTPAELAGKIFAGSDGVLVQALLEE
ncbi:MAG: leucine-rich repeat protein [Candidatus Methanomethylophilaceae archaeon]|nr:leucine-rich repeat protein [Candidatus Methanomethylophilaceae archaeon]